VALTIVIVDDSPQFRAAAAELLAERGFKVQATVEDAAQALAAMAGECPDGILLDICLSGADGFAVGTALAASCPQTKIVLTSANIGHVPAEVLQSCGMTAFLPKEELASADLGTLFMTEGM
jgi:CheY-like chemotaxis protein